MSRAKSLLLLLGALALVASVLYLGYRSRPIPGPPVSVEAPPGLAWLPAEATLVAGLDLQKLRGQAWLFDLADQASGGVQEEAEYEAFVATTGFDYKRDLDRLWLARLGNEPQLESAGVAEGRFDPGRIVAYAQAEATAHPYAGFTILETLLRPSKNGQPPRRFAFAFLDDTHLAFGSGVRRVQQVIDCWSGKASAVIADEARAAAVARAAAGRQAWVVDSGDEWLKLLPGDSAALADVITQAAAGLSVDEQGLELAADVQCREASQAARLRDNLRVMIVLGQLALGRDDDEAAQLIREALANLSLTVQDRSVLARISISQSSLNRLLSIAPSSQP